VSQHGSEPINAAYGLPGRVNGLSLQSSGMTDSLRWRVGLALQHRPDGAETGRSTVGIIGGIELPLREP
jgi:hypothetical protein